MSPKIRAGILFGGKSAEHEVSLRSARNVIHGMDRSKYDVILIGVDREGRWRSGQDLHFLPEAEDLQRVCESGPLLALLPGRDSEQIFYLDDPGRRITLDAAYPVIHGSFGEDGTMQGLLEILNIPCVGPGVLGSAVGMDKEAMKIVLREAGIASARYRSYRRSERDSIRYDEIRSELGSVLFIKPARQGSSVGVSKAENETEFLRAVEEAFRFDTKILIEERIVGREIEVSVLGNEEVKASVPGEVIPTKNFYSYEAKYLSDDGAKLEMPAKISGHETDLVKREAVRTFQALFCEGMARVDLFLTAEGKLYVNEINTLPGFTGISMYPKLWELSGLPLPELLDRLFTLARDRFSRDRSFQTTFFS